MGPKPGKPSCEAVQTAKSGLSIYDPSRGDSTVYARAQEDRYLKNPRRGAVIYNSYPQITIYLGSGYLTEPKPGKPSCEAAETTKSGLSIYDPSRGEGTVYARAQGDQYLKTLGLRAVPELAHRYPQIAVCVGWATRGGTDWNYPDHREGETALYR